uniref:Paired domain-containing protein n=1 Tax=Panagrellus redivivus TaxID=6233 RepID=A0A7E4W4T2_PANRE
MLNPYLTVPRQLDNVGESARNRFGRPYISGRPLLSCDRHAIVQMYQNGHRKVAIARSLGITHSCVSKVIRKFEKTGQIDIDKQSRTASCACPGEASFHDPAICRHYKYTATFSTQHSPPKVTPPPQEAPKVFTIDWILSSASPKNTASPIGVAAKLPERMTTSPTIHDHPPLCRETHCGIAVGRNPTRNAPD